jgi:hypothetical protein
MAQMVLHACVLRQFHLQTTMSRKSVQHLLQFLKEGLYIDSTTAAMQGRLVTYNAAALAFAIIDLTCTQDLAGTFRLQVDVTAVPVTVGMWHHGLISGFSQTVLIASSIGHIVHALYKHVQFQTKQFRAVRQLPGRVRGGIQRSCTTSCHAANSRWTAEG